MNLGEFLNSFVIDPTWFWALAVGTAAGLVGFSTWYNGLMDRLADKDTTSIFVAGGVLVTVLAVGLFSWKAAVIVLTAFGLSGLPMIVGDYRRSYRRRDEEKRKSNLRRKPLPYAAAGLIDRAQMGLAEARRALKAILTGKGVNGEELMRKIGLAATEVTEAARLLDEARKVEGG